MWNCEQCGCQAIAGDLASCPMCGDPRTDPGASPLTEDETGTAREVDGTEASAPAAEEGPPSQDPDLATDTVKKEVW